MGTYLTLDRISSYNIAFDLSNDVWEIVKKWDWFEKRTIGVQFTTAIDSILANVAEGFGRYSKKDKVRFYRMGYGSLFESKDWLEKAKIRKLVSQEEYRRVIAVIDNLPRNINQLIKFTNERLNE